MKRYQLSPGYWWLDWGDEGYMFRCDRSQARFYHWAGRFMTNHMRLRLAQATLLPVTRKKFRKA